MMKFYYAIPQKNFVGSQSQATLTSYQYTPGDLKKEEKSKKARLLTTYSPFTNFSVG